MECILTLARFYFFTIGFSFTYSHTHSRLHVFPEISCKQWGAGNQTTNPWKIRATTWTTAAVAAKKPHISPENDLSAYQLFLFFLPLEFLNFLSSLCSLTCSGLHGFREREGKWADDKVFFCTVQWLVMCTFLSYAFHSEHEHIGPYAHKCNLFTSVTRSHLISWIKELQQCFTTSLGDGNELSVLAFMYACVNVHAPLHNELLFILTCDEWMGACLQRDSFAWRCTLTVRFSSPSRCPATETKASQRSVWFCSWQVLLGKVMTKGKLDWHTLDCL